MALIAWSDSLAVKVKGLDEQHQELVRMINGLHDAMKAGTGKQVLTGLVDQLKDYARVHFKAEEELLRKHRYPDLATHRSEHEKFIAQVLDFEQAFTSGGAVLTMEVMNFLKNWLVGHIQGTDQKYSPFLNQQGIS